MPNRTRIIFLENREKTKFWEAVSLQMASQGCDISWIVQNPVFAPKNKENLHILGFPKKTQLNEQISVCNHPLLAAERGRRYFNAGEHHYDFYWKRIEAIIKLIKPKFVIGEATLVHELITIGICAEMGIPYLHPCAERYPDNRFAVFSGASQVPFAESRERMPTAEALEIARSIQTYATAPYYMRDTSRRNKLKAKLRWIATRANVWRGRLMGEVYNTPSLRRKIWLNRQAKRNIRGWHSLQQLPQVDKKFILYPLQMQPENNLDVWGLPNFDQTKIIKEILSACPNDVGIALKCNPKPSYEISDELISFAENNSRIILLPLSMNMQDAMKYCVGAVTVTGTVGYEAVAGAGRCISVAHPLLTKSFPDFTALTPKEAALALLHSPAAGRGSEQQGVDLLQKIYARSYPGFISDPITDPICLDPANISTVACGLLRAMNRPGIAGGHSA